MTFDTVLSVAGSVNGDLGTVKSPQNGVHNSAPAKPTELNSSEGGIPKVLTAAERQDSAMPATPDVQETTPPSRNGELPGVDRDAATVQSSNLATTVVQSSNLATTVTNGLYDTNSKVVTPPEGARSLPDIVMLDVGGKYFTVSRETLCKEESLLARMFSGQDNPSKTPEGRYFIDRNPKVFGLILNYLRDGFCLIPTAHEQLESLVRECEYYQLDSLLLELMKIWWPRNLVSVKLKMRLLARLGYSDTALGILGVVITRMYANPTITQSCQDLSIAVSYTNQAAKNNAHQVVSFMETGTVELTSMEVGARARKQVREHFASRYETYGAKSSNTVRKYDVKRYQREGFTSIPTKSLEEERALFSFHAKQEPLSESEQQTREFIELMFKHHEAVCHCLELLFGEANVNSELDGIAKDKLGERAVQYPTAILWKANVELP